MDLVSVRLPLKTPPPRQNNKNTHTHTHTKGGGAPRFTQQTTHPFGAHPRLLSLPTDRGARITLKMMSAYRPGSISPSSKASEGGSM